jgi:hypothetical protein
MMAPSSRSWHLIIGLAKSHNCLVFNSSPDNRRVTASWQACLFSCYQAAIGQFLTFTPTKEN